MTNIPRQPGKPVSECQTNVDFTTALLLEVALIPTGTRLRRASSGEMTTIIIYQQLSFTGLAVDQPTASKH